MLVSSFGTYFLAAKVSGPYMPWLAFVLLMLSMSIGHIHRQSVNDASVVDITGAIATP